MHKWIWKKHGSDVKRWPLTPLSLSAPWSYHSPAIETPPRPDLAGPLIPWPKYASCSRISPRASPASLPPRWCETACCLLPLHCASVLQPTTHPQVVSFSLGPSLLQFVSTLHSCWITETRRSLNREVPKDRWIWCIRHFSTVDKSATPNKKVRYLQVPALIPADVYFH